MVMEDIALRGALAMLTCSVWRPAHHFLFCRTFLFGVRFDWLKGIGTWSAILFGGGWLSSLSEGGRIMLGVCRQR